jgi:hypothetical protein
MDSRTNYHVAFLNPERNVPSALRCDSFTFTQRYLTAKSRMSIPNKRMFNFLLISIEVFSRGRSDIIGFMCSLYVSCITDKIR